MSEIFCVKAKVKTYLLFKAIANLKKFSKQINSLMMDNENTEKETVGIIKNGKNKRVIELLKKQGKTIVEFPEIQTIKLDINKAQINLLINIKDFNWLIFTDIFTVDYFIEEIEKTGFELYELDDFRICACGDAVSDKLRFSQIHSDVIPANVLAETIISSIKDYIFDNERFRKSNILIVKSAEKHSELSAMLTELHISNSEIEIYKIVEEDSLEKGKFKAFLSGGTIDRFMFTSPEDCESLLSLAKNKKLSELLFAIEIDTTDEITAQTLRERDLKI